MSILADFPNLEKVVNYIESKSMFQKKAINKLLEGADSNYLTFAEDLVVRLNKVIDRSNSYEYMAVAYLNYTKSIRVEEMYFAKEHKYRYHDFADVYKKVYSRDEYMYDYVVGLCMTQIFWPNHYGIVRFFLDIFLPKVKNFTVGAEAGVGHGLFHSELLRGAPEMNTTLVDISTMSLKMTQKMIAATGIDLSRVVAKECDVQKQILIEDESLDVLLMGELIEHLQKGEAVLYSFAKKMKPSGYCFFTTAINAPAEDHILLFNTTSEIRDMLGRSGWKIHEEHFGTLNGMSVREAEEGKHNVNYASIISLQ
jgi:2-polyprenyl-3-methyl-5-hydroxy-6-metoxy-1,4-benzoquinol methylase